MNALHAGGIGDAPIVDEYREQMKQLAHVLDEFLNGKAKGDKRSIGFVLMVFPFGGPGGRMNYVSNADRADVLATLKDQVARFEGRAIDQAGNA